MVACVERFHETGNEEDQNGDGEILCKIHLEIPGKKEVEVIGLLSGRAFTL